METVFTWRVADSGYQIEDRLWTENDLWRIDEPGTTTPRLIEASDTRWTIYSPLREYTGLFRTFAGLDGRDDILRFANKYGFIGTRDYEDLEFVGEDKQFSSREEWVRSPETNYFELLTSWLSEIRYLREAVRLWDALQSGDHAYLKQVIRWRRNPKRVSFDGGETPQLEEIQAVHPDGSPIRFGETVWPAWLFIRLRINVSLQENVSLALLWDDANELKFTLAPETLLSAIWLQFAEAVTYNLEYRECKWCSRSFEVTRTTRTDRLYCSNSCRVSASRKRTAKRK